MYKLLVILPLLLDCQLSCFNVFSKPNKIIQHMIFIINITESKIHTYKHSKIYILKFIHKERKSK